MFQKGKNYFLADGLHRLEGANKFGEKKIEADGVYVIGNRSRGLIQPKKGWDCLIKRQIKL